MPDTYTSQFSGEEIDAALRAAQIISGASTPAELRKKLEIRGDTIPVSATDPTPISEALTASGGGVNPNLLDNWFFGNPVNQRGQTEWTEDGYIIDRWRSGAKKVIVANKYITLQPNGTYSQIFQPFELQLAGKIVTMSALINTHSGHNVGMLLYDYANYKSYSPDFIVDTTANQWMVVSTSFRVADNAPDKLNLIFYPDKTEAGDQTADILAVKLELGDTQTLAHQDSSGNWILNEIPDFGEQLRRCQRYAFSPLYEAYATAIICNLFVSSVANGVAFGEVTLPVSMRDKPVFSGNASKFWIVAENGGGASHPTAIAVVGLSADKVMIQVNGSYTANTQYILYVEDPFTSADFLLSADL